MSRSQSPDGSTSVRRSVVEAYQQSLEARSIWAGFASALQNTATDRSRADAHAILHATTMQYYEAVRPYLASAPAGSSARDYWESAPLWPAEEVTKPGVRCASGHQYPEAEAAGQNCPECGETLQAASVPTADGACEWIAGLRNLQTFVDERDEVEAESGRWSTGTSTEIVAKRLDSDVLLRCARYLDEAASELGLLADVDDERPLAET
jgi:hypothetical protein